MTHKRRPSGTRPNIGSVPALPISVLHLRGWKWSERYGDATRAGALEYTRSGVVTGRLTYRATLGQQSGVLALECRFGGEALPTVEVIDIVSVPNEWGGRHWFFVCPLTGRRARKLYRWPGLRFSHREASPVPPVYACQQDSGMARTARAMDAIRKRLGGVPGKVEKPTGMSRRTFYRLSMRYVGLHERFWRMAWSDFTGSSRPI
jgi:hypothetical protein